MTEALLIAGAVAAAVAAILATLLTRSPPASLLKRNHAGRKVPAVLGLAFLGAIVFGVWAGPIVLLPPLLAADVAAVLPGVAGTLIVGAAGLIDDLVARGPRGIRAHLASLFRTGPSTGILKVVLTVAAAVMVAGFAGGGALRVAAAALVMTVSTNVLNTLDVVPGRALKWGILAMIPPLVAGIDTAQALLTGSAMAASLLLLGWDLRERGMLGDSGSNPLGFVVGYGYAVQLPTWGLAITAVLALILQVVAETVTISRLIGAVPPLRWLDRLGRPRT